MTEKQSKELKIGDRVSWPDANAAGAMLPTRTKGTVIETGYACNKIKWDDELTTIIAHDDSDLLEPA